MLHQNVAVVMQWVSQPWGGLCGALCPFPKDWTPSLYLFCSAKEKGVISIILYLTIILFFWPRAQEFLYGWKFAWGQYHCAKSQHPSYFLLSQTSREVFMFHHTFLEVCRESWEVLWQSCHVFTLRTVSFESVCNISWIFHIAFISRFERWLCDQEFVPEKQN